MSLIRIGKHESWRALDFDCMNLVDVPSAAHVVVHVNIESLIVYMSIGAATTTVTTGIRICFGALVPSRTSTVQASSACDTSPNNEPQ